MKIQIYQPLSIHEVGKRDNQEDALWREGATTDDRLFIVCDGMGGHSNSEIASQTFSQALGRWFAENANPNEKLSNEELDDLLQRAIDYAYQILDELDDGSFKKMGTTLTLLYIHAQGVLAAHIGDSRIYHIRPSERILYQSKDHSLVYDLYQAGEISYEEMATHPQKNVITKAVTPGEENRATPDIIHITDIKAGDYFYMCSDGMLERMSNGELFELFAAPSSDEAKRQQLIHATKDNADNHTAWIIHVESVLSESGDPIGNEEETSRCNALNIRPARPEEEAIEIADDSDVKVVGMARTRTPQGRPQSQRGRKITRNPERKPTKRNKWLLSFLCLLAACAGVIIIILWPHNRTSGIDNTIDTTKTDSTRTVITQRNSTAGPDSALVPKPNGNTTPLVSGEEQCSENPLTSTNSKVTNGKTEKNNATHKANTLKQKPKDEKNKGENAQPAPAPQPHGEKGEQGSELIKKLRDKGITLPNGMAEEDNDE